MPLYIKDDVTAELVGQLARKRGISKQAAVRLAVEAELKRIAEAIPPATADRRVAEFASAAAADRRKGRQGVLRRPVGRRLMVFVDASAMIAMITGGSDADLLADRLKAERLRLCSAISIWETIAGLCRSYMFSVHRHGPWCKASSS